MTIHVILAYGRESEHRRATFAILSFWAWFSGQHRDARTVVFTDKPDLFAGPLAGLPIDYVLLTPERLEQLRGPQNYVHRVKLAIIDQAFQDYPGANVLFTDSDTFFVAETDQLLTRLQPGTSLLHQREYRLRDAVGIYADFNQAKYPRRLLEFISTQTFPIGPRKQRFSPDQFSWNSGVLGLTPDVGHLMPDIIALNDALYLNSSWVTCEQIAFSLALQTQTHLEPSDAYVFHYWGQRQKQLMDGLLLQFLNSLFSEQVLFERLAQVRQLSIKWWRTVELDKDREGALYAFAHGKIAAGLKCALKAFIAAPFNATFARELVQALTQRSPSRAVSL